MQGIRDIKRAKVLTLDYIKTALIFVDESEVEDYKKANVGFEKNIISVPKGIQGNVARIRNYIISWGFKNNYDVVCLMDDDMKHLGRYEEDKTTDNHFGYIKHIISEDELYILINKYSLLCDELGYKYWGVQCNSDALSYRQYTPFSFTSIVLGPFCCFLDDSIKYDENLTLNEDYDMAIQQINKYRGCLRVNSIFYECLQSENKGGCATYRNMEREKEQFKLLQRKWGSDIVRQDKGAKKSFDYNPLVKYKYIIYINK